MIPDDIPYAVPPTLNQRSPNDPTLAYEGPAIFHGEVSATLPTTLTIDWLPESRTRFVSGPIEGAPFDMPDFARMEIDGSISDILVLEYDSSDRLIRGILNGQLELRPRESYAVLRSSVVNFHLTRGTAIRSERAIWAGRTEIESDRYRIILDETPGCRDKVKRLKSDGGAIVTHGLEVVRRDRTPIAKQEIAHLLDSLHFLLGFMRGFWCGPVASTSGDDTDDTSIILGSWLITRWRHVGSWFPLQHRLDFDAALNRFMELWAAPEWQRAIRHYVWWYVEANTAQTLESAIVLSQAGLELMSWAYVAEDRGLISPSGFDKLSAADKIRLLLRTLNVPTAIPTHYDDLARFAKAFNHEDGPAAIVDMRNAIIHPSLKKRAHLSSATQLAKFQAAELARQYVEYVLLAILGYSGIVRDRTVRIEGLPTEVLAPWAVTSTP